MEKRELIAVFPEIDYALVHLPNNTCTPYVAAWGFNGIDKCWCQGHYFRTKEGAKEHIIEVLKERYINQIKNI